MDFNYVQYITGPHARQQAVARIPTATWDNVEDEIQKLLKDGKVLIDVKDSNGEKFRYIRSGPYFIPCVLEGNDNLYKVISLLTWDMVLRSDTDDVALQFRLHRYH